MEKLVSVHASLQFCLVHEDTNESSEVEIIDLSETDSNREKLGDSRIFRAIFIV